MSGDAERTALQAEPPPAGPDGRRAPQRLQRFAILALLKLPMLLPYRARRATAAWLMVRVFSPLAGYPRRISANLAHVLPDLPASEVRHLCRAVPANTAHTLIETLSVARLFDIVSGVAMQGPGLADLDAARAANRPIIAVSGHFGNFNAGRAALVQRGHTIGGLYRPNSDPELDQHYQDWLGSIAEPIFPRSPTGLRQMVRFLKQGNTVTILLDQYVHGGAPVTFFGQVAPTSLSAAEMALKYDALLVPIYAIRRGLSFEITVDPPIPHSDPTTMTQAINDSLEARVRADMEQWLWIHRRWKPERQSTRAAASTAPGPSS